MTQEELIEKAEAFENRRSVIEKRIVERAFSMIPILREIRQDDLASQVEALFSDLESLNIETLEFANDNMPELIKLWKS